MQQGYVKFHEKGEGRALIELARQYEPQRAIKEFITNSLDARVRDSRTIEDIVVTINQSERRIVISDNGVGMDYGSLITLPTRVGFSEKAGKPDMRGEKAIGLLAFGSIGNSMHILSRPYGSQNTQYGYIVYRIDDSREVIPFSHRQLDSEEVEKQFYGNFPNGTRVVIDGVNPHILNKLFTIPFLRDRLRLFYNPALRKRTANIHIGRAAKSGEEMRVETLEPINYQSRSSSKYLDQVIPVEIKGEGSPQNLEVLLFVNPEGAYEKVAVYSKDVLVYESVAELDEFSRSPIWTSGKVSGYINDHFNKLVLGRAGIRRNTNAFKEWFGIVRELEEKLRPIVEEKKKQGRRVKETGYINEAFDAFTTAYRDIIRMENEAMYSRSRGGELMRVTGVEVPEPIMVGRTPQSRNPNPTEVRPPGPGTFGGSEQGIYVRVVQKSSLLFGNPQPIEFDASQMHLRSRLEEVLGRPTVFLNSTHPDYKERVEHKDPNTFRKYVIELLAKEAIYHEIRRAELEKKLVGNRTDIVQSALTKVEEIIFRALRKLEIK